MPFALVGLTVAAFGTSCGNGFVNFDDGSYVTANPHVFSGLTTENVAWAWTTTHAANRHPLTWLSLQLDGSLYGVDPFGYHLTSILLHAATAGLLCWLLRAMTGCVWPSFAAAAFFALHPLRIESVAWVAERKDVLCSFLSILTLSAYLSYVRRPSVGRYVAVFVALALALCAKPMAVTLPLVLILLDYWPLGRVQELRRFGRLVAEKLPLGALAAVSCVVTVLAQQAGEALSHGDTLSLGIRAENAIVAYADYLGKTLWPAGLAVYYPHPGESLPAARIAGAALLLVGLTGAAIALRRRCPYLLVGWLWYLGTLLPVIGLVQVGEQAMADRYTYIPSIGLCVAVAWAVRDLVLSSVLPLGVIGAAGVAVAAMCAVLTVRQIGYWHDSVALWRRALAVTTNSSMAANNLGEAVEKAGSQEAEALAREGRPVEASEVRRASLAEAVKNYGDALAVRPGLWSAHFNRGEALAQLGRHAEAAADFQAALKVNPDYAPAWYNLGLVRLNQGRREDAVDCFRKALEANRSYAPAREQLGRALAGGT